MKRGLIYLVLVFLIFNMINTNFLAEVESATITGDTITGDIVGSLDFNITVVAPPIISIIHPENKTYLINESLPLNFTADISIFSIWYNIDNGSNITITSNLTFNTSQGSHTLYLFANNTNGNTTKNTTFFINSSRLTILYSEYNGSLKGSSTDFIKHPYEDLKNLSNIVLENTENGKIQFNEVINITNDENFSDNLVDLDTHTNISFNRIELNVTALPNFNVSSTLTFYNLTFANPRILRDGIICPSSICIKNSYSGGSLSFNISNFGTFTTEETPVDELLPGPSGGGGSSFPPPISLFEVDKELIKVNLKIGGELKVLLTIKNIHKTSLNFNIDNNLKQLTSISETNFTLSAEESKEIELTFSADENFTPGVYTGMIKVTANDVTKEIPLIVEVETKEVIFDVSLYVPPEYKEIEPGEEIKFEITIFKLGDIKKAEVEIEYYIKDLNGNTIYSEKETIIVEDQMSLSRSINFPKNMKAKDYIEIDGNFIYSGENSVKTWGDKLTSNAINLPDNLPPGNYVLIIHVRYKGTVGTSSEIFKIKEPEPFIPQNKIFSYVIFLIIIILLIISYLIYKHMNKKIEKSTVYYKNKIRKARKGKEKIEAIEKAYAGGYIKKDSYQKARKRIKEMLKE